MEKFKVNISAICKVKTHPAYNQTLPQKVIYKASVMVFS